MLLNFRIFTRRTIWYLGDRHKDVIAALAASKVINGTITPIAVAFNAAMAILEKNLGPDHIIMSYHDMYDQLIPMFEDVDESGEIIEKKTTDFLATSKEKSKSRKTA